MYVMEVGYHHALYGQHAEEDRTQICRRQLVQIDMMSSVIRENRMVGRCVGPDTTSWVLSHITRERRMSVICLGTQRVESDPHAPIKYLFFQKGIPHGQKGIYHIMHTTR